MTVALPEDERAAIDAIRRFADEVLAPAAADLDEQASFATCHLKGLAELGIMGMNLPVELGGIGLSAPALAEGVAAIAGACASTASIVTAHFLATDAIHLGGDAALQQRYLPDAASGRTLGAFALTEPAAGSNPADMRMKAVRTAGGYHLQGVKHFISNGGVADFIVVFAVTDSSAAHRGISAFVVDRVASAVKASTPERTMGLKGGHVFELGFDCEIPAENRIGPEGSGFKTAMRVLDNGRVEVAAMCLGIAEAAFHAAGQWARERQIGGRPLGDNQGIQWMLADMATDLEAAKLLTREAAHQRQSGQRFSKASAMAKLFAAEMAGRVTDQALQIHGGYGFTRGLKLERLVRDVRIMRIYEGASEVQRNIIGRMVLDEAARS